MALHINDLVSLNIDGERRFYRVQKLDSGINRIMLRLHTAALLNNKQEEKHLSVNHKLFDQWGLQLHTVNAIGKIIE